jgi:hypothetical protein
VTVGGRELLASGSDSTVRLWDPMTKTCVVAVPTDHRVEGLAQAADGLAIAFGSGILVIKPDASAAKQI